MFDVRTVTVEERYPESVRGTLGRGFDNDSLNHFGIENAGCIRAVSTDCIVAYRSLVIEDWEKSPFHFETLAESQYHNRADHTTFSEGDQALPSVNQALSHTDGYAKHPLLLG